MTKRKLFELLNLHNLYANLEKNLSERFQVIRDSFFTGWFWLFLQFSPIFQER